MLYERDILAWSEQQAELLKQEQWSALDLEHLIEEIEALGRSEQRALGSYVQVLMMHLLKYQYQPERRTKSWDTTITNCRDKIADCLEDAPSLKRLLQDSEWLKKYYRRGRRDAAKETQMPLSVFPPDCPFSVEQLLDTNPENQENI